MQNIRIEVTGKVYKTGYRYFVKQLAEKYSITGFVHYTETRGVEIEAHGENDGINQFLAYCRTGCLGFAPEQLTISSCKPANYEDFEII